MATLIVIASVMAIVGATVGAFIAIPAIRLPGVFLALATFGFGVTMEQMGYPLWLMFGSSSLGQAVNRPSFAQGDIAYYYLVFAFAVLVSLMVMWLVRSRLGRLLRGMADSPVALATHGTSVMVTRVLVFCVSAFLAAHPDFEVTPAIDAIALSGRADVDALKHHATADGYLRLTPARAACDGFFVAVLRRT